MYSTDITFANQFLNFIFKQRTECGESCKQRKQLLESECKQLRRELGAVDEIKKSAEQQSRNYEQEVIIYNRFGMQKKTQ